MTKSKMTYGNERTCRTRLDFEMALNEKKIHLCWRSCLLASIFLMPVFPSYAADVLPTGGNVVAGSGAITQNGSAMTVTQTTDKMAVNWQGFSIGPANTVTFVQPAASSVALNRVVGSDVSVIQGKLNANGQIFLVNPNGILFTSTAQVNTGSLVASTLDIKTEDFMAGRYNFEGESANAIVNQGNITAANGGSIALIAAKITNTGTLTAQEGNVLAGAGSKVTLDLGGPVKIEVQKGAVDALITQGGAIKADGGTVYLTAKAVGDLITTVINNTGIIEAKTLSTGQNGKIYLIGDKTNGAINVSGTLDASAPNGGDGGFIETSAASVQFGDGLRVTAASTKGSAGQWLIDPTDITISASSCTGTNCIAASTIASTLNGGTNVTIATDSAGSDAGNITVNAPISWSQGKLTLSAASNILLNATLTATGLSSSTYGRLALEYGQGTANGGTSTYSFGNSALLYIPYASAFTWKKGSSGATKNLVFDNGEMRFGDGTEASITDSGQMKQPWYDNNNTWFQLTYSNYPLDMQIGEGGSGTTNWNTNGTVLATNNSSYQDTFTSAISSPSLEISGYNEGVGTIVAAENLSIGGLSLRVSNSYTLLANTSYLKTVTSITNQDSTNTASNVRLWVGTRDDYVGGYDSTYKTRGNLTSDGFVAISNTTAQAKALKIASTTSDAGTAVLFYSTSDGAETSINSCCNFSNSTNTDPRNSSLTLHNDGSYALYIRLDDLVPGSSGSMTWYYAASSVAQINNVVAAVSTSAGVTPAVAPVVVAPVVAAPIVETPVSVAIPVVVAPVVTTSVPFTAAIQTAQTHIDTTPTSVAASRMSVAASAAPLASNTAPSSSRITTSGSLQLVEISNHDTGSTESHTNEATGPRASESTESSTVLSQGQSGNPFDAFKVFVVNGGVRMPDDVR